MTATEKLAFAREILRAARMVTGASEVLSDQSRCERGKLEVIASDLRRDARGILRTAIEDGLSDPDLTHLVDAFETKMAKDDGGRKP